MEFDVAIIGGGPAGSSAAIRLRQRGFRVLVIEKDLFPRQKLCGEFLSPEVLHLAGDLGLKSELLDAGPAVLNLVRLHLYGESPLDIPLSSLGLGLSRAVLDHLLLRHAVRSGAEVLEQTTAESVCRHPSGEFSVVFRRNGQLNTAVARAVICAAGRWSRWSRQTRAKDSPRRQAQTAYSFKAYYDSGVATVNTLDLYFFTGGYCGLSQVEGGRANVCYLIEKRLLNQNAAARMDPSGILLQQPSLSARLLGGERVSEFLFTGPLVFGRPRPVHDFMAMVGDSAGFIDPFCGDGISIALHSGLLAAEALEPLLLGKRSLENALNDYARAYQRAFWRQFRWSGWLRNLAGSSRATRGVVRIIGASHWLGQELFARTRVALKGKAGQQLQSSRIHWHQD